MTDPAQFPHRPHGQRDVDGELEEMLVEAEETVARLRAELELRRVQADDQRTEAAQHAEIDRLEEHLANTKVRWSEVREFFESAWRELLRSEPAVGGVERETSDGERRG